MILLVAINSVQNYLKNGTNSNEKQMKNKDWKTLDSMECFKISNLCLFQKTTLSIQINEEGKIIYQKDGSILYIEQYDSLFQAQNLEQLKFLRWHGQYNNKQQKIGKWQPQWKGVNLEVGGLYCNQGMKTGNWIELFENFWDKSQVTFIGLYLNNKKQGKCGEGYYDYEGISQGYWINLHRNFYDGRQIIYKGSYNNGTKQGWWDISFHSYFDSRFKKIGGGYYNRDGKKNGKWIEVSENFWNGCQILEKGEYRNGLKIGIWESQLKEYIDDNYKLIGLGCYNIDRKNGKWIEIHQKSMSFIHSKYFECKIINVGNYKEGLKIGNWISIDQQTENIIGGGDYNQNGQKLGIWVEAEDYSSLSKITQKGRYVNGNKEGQWQINLNNQKIGGGNYNDRGLKFGQWIEIYDKFWDYCKVLFVGNYKEGIKIGDWEVHFYQQDNNSLKIGKGTYNDLGMKTGQWTELSETFWEKFQVIYEGQYSNGIKSGKWNAFFTGHLHNRNGIKIQKWMDLYENYLEQPIYVGKYQDGIIMQEFKQIKQMLYY
ncbi:unnamed protein product [Paramecium pentaurelia]|uniref:Uncharacterized protein n=1 Tax=Paramecium pentaurelia TaxID=43138 RepID=A0A8S1UYX4_9CILI|nr:unnamed protein product [Paramecium pentaurelia]